MGGSIQQGLQEHFKADYAGVMGWHTGDLPDHRTRANAEKHGIKLNHKGRKITIEDLDAFDHIVAMDEENFEAIHTFYYETKKVTPSAKKLFLLRDYDPNRNNETSVPDPYYGSAIDFENVFQIVKRSNEVLLKRLSEHLN